jgi:hypothetical protein
MLCNKYILHLDGESLYHISIVVNKERHTEWKTVSKAKGFPSVSQFVRFCVDEFVKNKDVDVEPFEKELEPIKGMLFKIDERQNMAQEFIELINTRMQTNEGSKAVVLSAAREIAKLLLRDDKNISDILNNLTLYNRETVNAAIILLHDLRFIGSYRIGVSELKQKKKEQNNMEGEQK